MPRAGDLVRVTDLNIDHHGWLVRLPAANWAGQREITLIGVRVWQSQGMVRVGLMDWCREPPWRGTEYHVPGRYRVVLVRRIRSVPPRRDADYRRAGART